MSIFILKRFLFNLYLSLPGNKYLFQMIKRVYIPSHRLRSFLRFKGIFNVELEEISFKMRNYGNTIENELFWLGVDGWEPFSTKAWKRLSKQSKIIFDVGANTGLYSLISGKANPGAKIYAFEPVELIFQRLNKNIKINELNVSSHRVALADEDGEGKIYAANTISNTFDQASLNNSKGTPVRVSALTIKKQRMSHFISDEGISNIDLMKIDVETYEGKVLLGMEQYLKVFKPTMLIEILNEDVAKEVEGLVASLDYVYYLIDEKRGYVRKSNLIPGRRGGNFLLVNTTKHNVRDLVES